MAFSLPGTITSWFAYRLFRSPFARRSERVHQWTMKLFRYGAERGNCSALATYGSLLHFRGSDESSRLQGALYIKAAAEQGDLKSCWLLAQFYERGVLPVIAQDSVKALALLQTAATQGHPLAIKRLIKVYRDGELGEAANPELVAKWSALQSGPDASH